MSAAITTAADAITCPMGEGVEETAGGAGPGCLCRVAKALLTRETDSRSLQLYCAGDYASCPTWQAHKNAEAADQERSLNREIASTAPGHLR